MWWCLCSRRTWSKIHSALRSRPNGFVSTCAKVEASKFSNPRVCISVLLRYWRIMEVKSKIRFRVEKVNHGSDLISAKTHNRPNDPGRASLPAFTSLMSTQQPVTKSRWCSQVLLSLKVVLPVLLLRYRIPSLYLLDEVLADVRVTSLQILETLGCLTASFPGSTPFSMRPTQ